MAKDRLEDATALVTGGTSGIGLELVRRLQKRGARVRFCARSSDRVAQVERDHPGTIGFVCDVTDEVAVAKMAQTISAQDGKIDILIANVGASRETNFAQAPIDGADIRAQIELNLIAPILNVNRLLPLLRQSDNPHLVMIGSGYGWSPSSRAPLYSAAKAAIRSLTQSLRMQLATFGVQVMEVVPPVVDTPATQHRAVAKLSPGYVADRTIDAMLAGKRELFLGQARAIPILLRLAPRLVERMVGKS